jgi:two-component sensor histidine kinase
MMTEIHHRVKNNIASILSMLRVEGRFLSDADAREVLERIALRVESMGALYELLAVNENTGEVGLKAYFGRVCRSIEQMSGSSRHGWAIEVEGDDASASVDDAIALGAVVNELVANAAKYAFDGLDGEGRISVALADRGTELAIAVADNGSGFDDRAVDPKSTGLGMRLVEMYLANLRGGLERETGPGGTRYLLRIPRGEDADVASKGRHGRPFVGGRDSADTTPYAAREKPSPPVSHNREAIEVPPNLAPK